MPPARCRRRPELAVELADVADRITLSRFRADDLIVETKPDLTPVSEADTAVERAIREMLAEVRHGDPVGYVRKLDRDVQVFGDTGHGPIVRRALGSRPHDQR